MNSAVIGPNKNNGKSQNRGGKICVSLMVLILIFILSVQIGSLWGKNESYKAEEARIQAAIDLENQKAAELADMEEYVKSDQYKEDTARIKLGMTYPDEIIFKEK